MKPLFYLFIALPALAAPQQFRLDLSDLAAKASNSVDLSLTGPTLRLASKFLDSSDPEEAGVKKLIEGLEGIYVRHFEFKKDSQWNQADLDKIRGQLHAPEWQRIVGVKEADSGENSEVYLRVEGDKNTGVAIITWEPREVTVINVAGPIDLDQLANLGGHFDIPKITPPAGKEPKGKKEK